MSDEDKIKAERAMGEPVLPEFSEDLRRTRRNLLVVSSVLIFAQISKVQITAANFFAFKISNPSQTWLYIGATCVLAYLLLQFCWKGWDYIHFMRIRVTGSRLSHVTTGRMASDFGDYPSDPNQSNLYYWWTEQARKIGNLSKMADDVHIVANRLQEVAKQPGNIDMSNINHVTSSAGEINNKISSLENRLTELQKVLNSTRIPTSLERYDRWFYHFKKSQVCRIVMLDLVFPLVLGVTAMYLWIKELAGTLI